MLILISSPSLRFLKTPEIFFTSLMSCSDILTKISFSLRLNNAAVELGRIVFIRYPFWEFNPREEEIESFMSIPVTPKNPFLLSSCDIAVLKVKIKRIKSKNDFFIKNIFNYNISIPPFTKGGRGVN
jgi:hypothetical protein